MAVQVGFACDSVFVADELKPGLWRQQKCPCCPASDFELL